MKIYHLEHIYSINEDEEEIKYIGTFSSEAKAIDVINILIDKPGFKDFPKNCFQIHSDTLDRFEWQEGFTSWEDANEPP